MKFQKKSGGQIVINFCIEQKIIFCKEISVYVLFFNKKSHESIDLQEKIGGMIGRIPEVFDDREQRRECKGHYD